MASEIGIKMPSKIQEMLDVSEKTTAEPWDVEAMGLRRILGPDNKQIGTQTFPYDALFVIRARNAIPDIKRIVEWLTDKAEHGRDCGHWYEKSCDCGLSEIQSLIRR